MPQALPKQQGDRILPRIFCTPRICQKQRMHRGSGAIALRTQLPTCACTVHRAGTTRPMATITSRNWLPLWPFTQAQARWPGSSLTIRRRARRCKTRWRCETCRHDAMALLRHFPASGNGFAVFKQILEIIQSIFCLDSCRIQCITERCIEAAWVAVRLQHDFRRSF